MGDWFDKLKEEDVLHEEQTSEATLIDTDGIDECNFLLEVRVKFEKEQQTERAERLAHRIELLAENSLILSNMRIAEPIIEPFIDARYTVLKMFIGFNKAHDFQPLPFFQFVHKLCVLIDINVGPGGVDQMPMYFRLEDRWQDRESPLNSVFEMATDKIPRIAKWDYEHICTDCMQNMMPVLRYERYASRNLEKIFNQIKYWFVLRSMCDRRTGTYHLAFYPEEKESYGRYKANYDHPMFIHGESAYELIYHYYTVQALMERFERAGDSPIFSRFQLPSSNRLDRKVIDVFLEMHNEPAHDKSKMEEMAKSLAGNVYKIVKKQHLGDLWETLDCAFDEINKLHPGKKKNKKK